MRDAAGPPSFGGRTQVGTFVIPHARLKQSSPCRRFRMVGNRDVALPQSRGTTAAHVVSHQGGDMAKPGSRPGAPISSA